MTDRLRVATITGTSPSNASGVAVVGNVIAAADLLQCGSYDVIAKIIGGVTGTIDAVLQTKTDAGTDEWADWIRFPQVAAGTTSYYRVSPSLSNTITPIKLSTGASPTYAIAANTCVGGNPGSHIRLVASSGAGETTGATQTVRIRGHRIRY